nr:hypothetical protein [Tanacetum cinerariifolium]
MGIMPTEMELILEQTQQGISHEVSVTLTKQGRMTKPYLSPRFIANCFDAGDLKMEVKMDKDDDLKYIKMRMRVYRIDHDVLEDFRIKEACMSVYWIYLDVLEH